MPAKFVVSRSELVVEAGYRDPQFRLFRDESGLIGRLVTRLSPHGLTLNGMKIERGSGTLGELHLVCYLLDYAVTARIRVDRVEINCTLLTEENKSRVIAAAVDTLDCVREGVGSDYRAYAVAMNIHGLLEGKDAKSFLGRLIASPPADVGAVAGNAVAYYFAPVDDRIAASLTLDVSAVTTDGLYARPQATWDASRLPLERLAERAEQFVRHTLASFGIEVPV